MASSEHRYGDCLLAVQAIMRGAQDLNVRGETKGAAHDGMDKVIVRVGQVQIVIQDRAALESWVTAIRSAIDLGERLFPWDDAVDDAYRADRDYIAKYGKVPPR